MRHVQFNDTDNNEDDEERESVDVRLDDAVRDAIVSEDAKRLESLVGPNAERRPTEPMPQDRWFASSHGLDDDDYCYLCQVDPYDDDEAMRNEHRENMKKWVAVADSFDIKDICKAIQDIYNEHIFPLTQRHYRLEKIREHIHHHGRIDAFLLLRQNIRINQRFMDYWSSKLVFKASPELGDSPDQGQELNEAAERNIRVYQKQMMDCLKLYAQLEARKK